MSFLCGVCYFIHLAWEGNPVSSSENCVLVTCDSPKVSDSNMLISFICPPTCNMRENLALQVSDLWYILVSYSKLVERAKDQTLTLNRLALENWCTEISKPTISGAPHDLICHYL